MGAKSKKRNKRKFIESQRKRSHMRGKNRTNLNYDNETSNNRDKQLDEINNFVNESGPSAAEQKVLESPLTILDLDDYSDNKSRCGTSEEKISLTEQNIKTSVSSAAGGVIVSKQKLSRPKKEIGENEFPLKDNTNKKRKSECEENKENAYCQSDVNKKINKKSKVSHLTTNTECIMDAEETCLYEVEAYSDVECTKVAGRRIVNIQSFFDKLKAIANHSSLFNCGFHCIEIVSECKKGLYSRLNLECTLCKKKIQVETTDQDINKNAVSGIMASGGGHAQLQQLTAAVDLPDIGANAYAKIQDQISDEWETTAWTEMLKAGQAEREYAIKERRVSKDGIAMIDVIVDGCWSKRSYQTNYAASSGCAAIIGRRTGKVLYMAVKNKYCCICQNNGNTPKEHPCYKNFEGPSTAMESTIIAEGFKRSIEMHNIIYQRFIADGDSSTYAKIIDCRPYPNVTVEKLNCINHILRRFCNNMQKLITDTRYPLKDRKLITKGKILSARKYIGDAIKLESKEKNYENVHANINNSVCHAFGNHCKCKKNICSLTEQKVTEFNTSSLWQRVKMLAANVASHSRSLIKNVDSNVVEQFNGVIAKLVGGKRINYTQRRGYQTRCSGAVISFNTGKLLSTVFRNTHHKSPSKTLKKYDEKVCLKRERNRRMIRKKKRCFNTLKPTDLNYGENAEQPDKDPVIFNMDKEAFLKNLEKSDEERNRIQKQTILQSECGQWLELRRNLLTASNFGKVIKRRKNHSCRNMVKNMLYSKSLDNVSSIQHGRQHEAVAFEQLCNLKGMTINKCGLFIDEIHSFLGATPDGIAGDMAVEIKCPIAPFKTGDIDAEIDKNKMHFWKKCKNGEVIINKRSDWFYQAQGQMHIAKKSQCLFAVWYGENKFKIEILDKDDNFWRTEMEPKLISFYMDCLLPELVDPRQPRNKLIRDNEATTSHQPPTSSLEVTETPKKRTQETVLSEEKNYDSPPTHVQKIIDFSQF